MTITMIDRAMPRAARRQQTAELLKEAATSKGARRDELLDQVIVLNIGVAHAIAHRYRNRSVPVEDLEQVACMALVRAAHKFDVSQERDFLTYAVPTISGEIKAGHKVPFSNVFDLMETFEEASLTRLDFYGTAIPPARVREAARLPYPAPNY